MPQLFPVILLKQGEKYIDLSEMKELCSDEYEIKCLVPMKEYYKDTEALTLKYRVGTAIVELQKLGGAVE